MFETILRGSQPWYFGHLHLPGGFQMTRTGESRFRLKHWREEAQDEERFDNSERSAVVGCWMQITDYRRLEDGRLCLFVQALDRFVVVKVVQEFPYSIADIQILPDEEEMPEGLVDENFGRLARGAAVQRAFQYHPYEFDNTKLPILKNQEYTSSKSINAAAIENCFRSLISSLLDGNHWQKAKTNQRYPQKEKGSRVDRLRWKCRCNVPKCCEFRRGCLRIRKRMSTWMVSRHCFGWPWKT
jgi:hypothetical protein